MKTTFCLPAICFVLTLIVTTAIRNAQADPLYDNGPPNQQSGAEMTHWIVADDFILNAPALLTNVQFWTFESENAFQSSIVWQIYANSNGRPGTLLFSGTSENLTHTATGLLEGTGTPEFVLNFDLGPVPLPAGTFWLGLHNGPLTMTNVTGFFWESTDPNSTWIGESDVAPFGNQNGFEPITHQCAFQLNVPETGSGALFLEGFGLIGVFFAQRILGNLKKQWQRCRVSTASTVR